MKASHLEIKIPVLYVLLFSSFIFVSKSILDYQSRHLSEIGRVIYAFVGIFSNEWVIYLFVCFIFSPLVMLGIGIYKRRKDIIIGSAICMALLVAFSFIFD